MNKTDDMEIADLALLKDAKSAWPAFLAAHDALIVQIEARLAKSNLPELGWYDVLWALDNVPEKRLRMHELADAAVIARSNLTRLTDRMEKAGLVERLRVKGDRRGAHAHLTRQGEKMRRDMWSVYKPAIQDCFGSLLSEKENTLLRTVMLRLLAASRSAR